jgi:RimJ/RimL family protein N-acetyltransferase
VLPEHSGHGYATEAARELIRVGFEHYRLRRVVADLDERNDRSRALCERLGMRQERHAVADFWSKGEWTSSYSYALLADEWQASRGH